MSHRTATLSEVAVVFNGKTPSKKEQRDSGHPVLKIKDVNEDGKFKGKFESFVDKEFQNKHSSKEIRVNDTLILNAAHNADYVGSKQFCAEQEVEGSIATGEWLIVRADEENLDSKYVSYWLSNSQTRFRMKGLVKGIHLYPKDVARLEIPLPPLPEQKRIAAILDKADAIRRKRQQAIQLADQFLRAVFLEMFGDPVTKGWDVVPVEKLALDDKGSIRTGPFGSQLLHSEFTDKGIAVLGIDNAVSNTFRWAKPRFISKEKYKELKRYTVKPSDLLITIMGTCGRAAIVPDNCPLAINTKHLCCITLNQEICTPEFLHSYFLMHPGSKEYLSRSAKGAVMDGLNMGIIKELPVYLPPIDLQRKYSSIYKKMLVSRSTHESSDLGFESLFSSLSQKAFLGGL